MVGIVHMVYDRAVAAIVLLTLKGAVALVTSVIAKPVRHMVVAFAVQGGHADQPGFACQVKVGYWAGAFAVVTAARASRKR